MAAIPESEWQWFGNAGHLVVSDSCLFHLCTKVGDYLISTVGDYHPPFIRDGASIKPGRAETAQEIGWQRTFETMVFKCGLPCECGCGMPTIDGSEEVCIGYTDRSAANKGHSEACREWATKG